MIASVPSRAPSTPPLTGASRNCAPRSRNRCAAERAVSALTVEQSMTIVPWAHGRQQCVDHVEHVRVGGHADDDDVAERGEIGGLSDRRAAGLAREGLSLCWPCDSRRRSASRACEGCAPCPGPWRPGRRIRRVASLAHHIHRGFGRITRGIELCVASGSGARRSVAARTASANSCRCRSVRAPWCSARLCPSP